MGRRIEVEDDEPIDNALRRLRRSQCYEYKRWTKKRYGYYEKPSALRRKQRKMAEIWLIKFGPRAGGSCRKSLHLYLGLEELFSRSGPINTAGY